MILTSIARSIGTVSAPPIGLPARHTPRHQTNPSEAREEGDDDDDESNIKVAIAWRMAHGAWRSGRPSK